VVGEQPFSGEREAGKQKGGGKKNQLNGKASHSRIKNLKPTKQEEKAGFRMRGKKMIKVDLKDNSSWTFGQHLALEKVWRGGQRSIVGQGGEMKDKGNSVHESFPLGKKKAAHAGGD